MFQLLAEQKKYDDEMRRQLKLQSEIHADHLREALSVKEQEAQRKLQLALSEQTEADSIKHKTQLAAVVGRLRALTTALKGEYLSTLYILRLFTALGREIFFPSFFFSLQGRCCRTTTRFISHMGKSMVDYQLTRFQLNRWIGKRLERRIRYLIVHLGIGFAPV